MQKPTDNHLMLGAGRRMTRARREIIALLKTGIPLSIQMIVKKVSANETSVYRTIQFLKSEEAVEEIAFPDGTLRYTLMHEHHHHIICTTCGYTEHVPCTQPLKEPVQSGRFRKIFGHGITYYGHCAVCV